MLQCVAVPILEELLFRGLIFARIWPVVGLWPAVLITRYTVSIHAMS
jgi:membrane protease YdiL (CAAX protease family)